MPRPTVRLASLAPFLVLPAIALLAVWMVSAEHRILPGLDGCMRVRHADARIDCLQQETLSIAKEQGAPAALAAVTENRSLANAPNECHMALHRLGEREGRAAGSLSAVPASATFCSDGFVHGFTIGASRSTPDKSLLARCGAGSQRAGANCAHSAGHLLARRHDGSVPMIERLCSGGDVTAQRECLHGASMELHFAAARTTGATLDCAAFTTPLGRSTCREFDPVRRELER